RMATDRCCDDVPVIRIRDSYYVFFKFAPIAHFSVFAGGVHPCESSACLLKRHVSSGCSRTSGSDFVKDPGAPQRVERTAVREFQQHVRLDHRDQDGSIQGGSETRHQVWRSARTALTARAKSSAGTA